MILFWYNNHYINLYFLQRKWIETEMTFYYLVWININFDNKKKKIKTLN